MSTETKPHITDRDALTFLRELKSQLPYSSTRKIVSLVRAVISKVRATQPISMIAMETSLVFHLMSVSSRYESDKSDILHLDELVDELYQEDQNQSTDNRFFKSEIDALTIITKVLEKLQSLFSSAGTNAFNHTLTMEIQQACQAGL